MASRMFLGVIFWTTLAACATADDAAPGAGAKYTLRYKFRPGETLRWNVVHRCRVNTSVSAATQTAETTTTSVKAWRVSEVRPDGTAVFEHLVEEVDMRHKFTDHDEVRYNSRIDLHAPAGFEDVAGAVGVTLSVVTLDPKGKVVDRKRNPVPASVASKDDLTLLLPEQPIAVGYQWSLPREIELPQPGGGIRRIESVQTCKLLDVKTGIATIHVATQILTPIHEPALESQLLQYESSGSVRFDIDAGRVIGQQWDIDKGVVGFRGEASSVHYLGRFSEEFLPAESTLAGQPTKRR